jgi:hypothetical protein
MWPIEIPQFLTQKLKYHPGFELGALEAEFGPLPVGWMRNLILPNFKKSTSIRVCM